MNATKKKIAVNVIPAERIEKRIYLIRGQKVMLDRDLAGLYGVETRRMNEQVRRNLKRFPPDFMFKLNKQEMQNWMSQIATSNKERKGLRKLPLAFTEHGILMLSSVLNSDRAIQINIQIMRAFTKLRELMLTHKDLARRIEKLEEHFEKRFQDHDKKITVIFDAIRFEVARK